MIGCAILANIIKFVTFIQISAHDQPRTLAFHIRYTISLNIFILYHFLADLASITQNDLPDQFVLIGEIVSVRFIGISKVLFSDQAL